MLACGAFASAQNLGNLLGNLAGGSQKGNNILNTVGNVVYSYVGKGQTVSLPGNWIYKGAAIEVGGDNALTNVAGTALTSGAENKVNGYLSKVGIKEGAMRFTFNEDLTFSCTIMKIPISGTWRTGDDGRTVSLQFGKNMKFLSMTGTLEGSMDGCKILFPADKFLSFVKSAMSVVGKLGGSTGDAISSLAGNYSKMKVGMSLKRQ